MLQGLRVVVRPSVLPEGEHVGDIQGGGWKERRPLSTSDLCSPASWHGDAPRPTTLRAHGKPPPDIYGAQGESSTLAAEVLMGIHHPWHPSCSWAVRHSGTHHTYGSCYLLCGPAQIWPFGTAPEGSLGARRNPMAPALLLASFLPPSYQLQMGYLCRTGCSPPPACRPPCC